MIAKIYVWQKILLSFFVNHQKVNEVSQQI
jgi:hypothetical protein